MRSRLLPSLAMVAALLAGCQDDAAMDDVALPPVPQAVVASEAVDWDGMIAMQHCGTVVVLFACGSFGLTGGENVPTYRHDANGRDLAGGNLTLTWESLTPMTRLLHLTVSTMDGCPNECTVNRTIANEIDESPLSASLPAFELDDNGALLVTVELVDLVQGQRASIGQEIHLAGNIDFVEWS